MEERELENEDIRPASPLFVQMRRPHQARGAAGQGRAPRPHSIGASIISNPKLVKGWAYYDNSPHPKSMQKYFSSVNLPPAPPKEEDLPRTSDDHHGRPLSLPLEETEEHDAMIGVEIKARVADEDDETGKCHQFLGIFLALLASSCLAFALVLAKQLLDEKIDDDPFSKNECCKYHPSSIAVWTFQGIFLPSLVVYSLSRVAKMARGESKSKEELRINYLIQRGRSSCRKTTFRSVLIIIRGVFGFGAVALQLYSLREISVPEYTIIAFMSPIFIVIAAWICLKERLGFVPIFIAAAVLIGVGLTTKHTLFTRDGSPKFSKEQLTGCLMAAGCVALSVCTVIILRYVRDVHYALINSIYGLIGTVGGFMMCLFLLDEKFPFPGDSKDWYLAAAMAGLTFAGQNLLTAALKYEEAGVVSVVQMWGIPMTLLADFLIRREKYSWLSLISGAVVVFGVFILIIRKWLNGQPESRKARRALRFLLV